MCINAFESHETILIRSGVVILPFDSQRDDLGMITQIVRSAYSKYKDRGIYKATINQNVEETLRRLKESGAEGMVVYSNGQLVGTITVNLTKNIIHENLQSRFNLSGKKILTFSQYAIDPSFQGGGIGKQVLSWVENRARSLGADYLALSSAYLAEESVQYYQNRNYSNTGILFQRPQAEYLSLILIKRLKASIQPSIGNAVGF